MGQVACCNLQNHCLWYPPKLYHVQSITLTLEKHKLIPVLLTVHLQISFSLDVSSYFFAFRSIIKITWEWTVVPTSKKKQDERTLQYEQISQKYRQTLCRRKKLGHSVLTKCRARRSYHIACRIDLNWLRGSYPFKWAMLHLWRNTWWSTEDNNFANCSMLLKLVSTVHLTDLV